MAKRVMEGRYRREGPVWQVDFPLCPLYISKISKSAPVDKPGRIWLWLSGLSTAMHAHSATLDIRFSRTIRDLVLLRALPALLLVGLLITALIE